MLQDPQILVVDDDASVRRVIRAFLERDGHGVREASSAQEALELFTGGRLASPPALLITDVRMPEMDGNELIRRIHELRPSQKVLFITAYPGDIDSSVTRFESIGKPFTGSALRLKVNSLILRLGCSSAA